MMKRIIFHHSLPLNTKARSASGIRPLRMLEAFQNIGCDVTIVSGYYEERKLKIDEICRKIENKEVKYSLMYSEASTMPTIMTEPNHIPRLPFVDYKLFKACAGNNIKIGVFYRDVYWLYKDYYRTVGLLKGLAASMAFIMDLHIYKKTVDKVYFPSKGYQLKILDYKYTPFKNDSNFDLLPPGLNIQNSRINNYLDKTRKLKLFYVGGVGDIYKMHVLFDVIASRKDVEMVFCCRNEEWQKVKEEYNYKEDNIRIIHEHGTQMAKYLNECDVALNYFEPIGYREFAVPFKVYEYIGYGKPILSSNGTYVSKMVADNNLGWVVDYNQDSLKDFLDSLVQNFESFEYILSSIYSYALDNTWENRAKKVVQDLL